METKELKITPPKGYEIDKENSTFECIKFKKKSLTYEDVASALFKDTLYYTDGAGDIRRCDVTFSSRCYPNSATSKKQLEKLLTINKLMNVQRYLCPDYKPTKDKESWVICINHMSDEIYTAQAVYSNYLDVFFPSEKLAKQAIDILGEDTIRLALSTDW